MTIHSQGAVVSLLRAGNCYKRPLPLLTEEPAMKTVDRCQDRMHRAGWSIDECTFILANRSRVWLVTCTHAGHLVSAMAPTHAGAWEEASRQVVALGMPQEGA